MENDMMNNNGPGRAQAGGGIAGIGNASLTSSEVSQNTIKIQIEHTQCNLNESRELIGIIETIVNEISGPEDAGAMKEEGEQDPYSLLTYLENHNSQHRKLVKRLGSISRRLRETLG